MHNDSLNGKWFSCDVVITHQGHHAGSSITWAKENEKNKPFRLGIEHKVKQIIRNWFIIQRLVFSRVARKIKNVQVM
jgi:hypothetical protein